MIELIHSDCLTHMQSMGAARVDAIVTDPPYGLSFMGKDWDHGVPGVHFWEEALMVAKPGAYLLAFGGTRTFHRLAVAIEDAGWEMRDTLMWVYGSGFPKSHDVSKAIDRAAGLLPAEAVRFVTAGRTDKNLPNPDRDYTPPPPATEAAKQWQGWGTALKPAWEPIIMARKPLEGTVASNVLKHGTGAINVDGCRVEGTPRTTHTEGNRIGDRSGATSIAFGKEGTEYEGATGRWPANVIHDGSDEVVGMFPQSTDGIASGKSRGFAADGYVGGSGSKYNGEPQGFGGSGSAARFFYCAKASKADRDEGLKGFAEARKAAADFRPNHAEKAEHGEDGNPYGRWNKVRNNHPTVKPTDLMRYLCRLVTPPKGIVFDPFMGSGSTGKAAILEGFSFIGGDLQEEYVRIARARIEHAKRLRVEELGLFAEVTAA